MDGTFGGRAKERGGEESERKEASLSDTDLARTERDNECTACDGEGDAEDESGGYSSAGRSAAIIAVKLWGGELRLLPGVSARGRTPSGSRE